MSYIKQNFTSGQTLKAAQLNYIEDGIVELERVVEGIDIPKTLPNPHSLTINDVTYDGSEDVSINLNSGGSSNSFYTDLSRTQQTVTVNCYDLIPGEEYEIHLYTASRRRGNAKGRWLHPSNTNTGVGFTGKGYARLAGRTYASVKIEGRPPEISELYPSVPEWMPNDGILQTEWGFTASGETDQITIDLRTWLLPMLKPLEGDWDNGYALIGIGVSKLDPIVPLMMQFRIVRKSTGEVGNSIDILRVGQRRGETLDIGPAGNITGLYVSIK